MTPFPLSKNITIINHITHISLFFHDGSNRQSDTAASLSNSRADILNVDFICKLHVQKKEHQKIICEPVLILDLSPLQDELHFSS